MAVIDCNMSFAIFQFSLDYDSMTALFIFVKDFVSMFVTFLSFEINTLLFYLCDMEVLGAIIFCATPLDYSDWCHRIWHREQVRRHPSEKDKRNGARDFFSQMQLYKPQ